MDLTIISSEITQIYSEHIQSGYTNENSLDERNNKSNKNIKTGLSTGNFAFQQPDLIFMWNAPENGNNQKMM